MSNLNPSQLPAWTGNVDIANDVVMLWKNSNATLYKATPNQLANLASQWVGISDTQTLTAKTLTSPTISGPTLSGTIIGTYTIGGTPTFPSSVVTLTGSQTVTNKTFTSPTINAPTITNATISSDALTGFTNAANGTFYGISVSSSVITTAKSVAGAALTDSSVTASKLSTGAGAGTVEASGTTSSTSYTSTLSGSTASSCVVTVGVNGLLLIGIRYTGGNSGSDSQTAMSFALSGANTVAATSNYEVRSRVTTATGQQTLSGSFLLTGLTVGSTTITGNFLVTAGTGTFVANQVWAVPL